MIIYIIVEKGTDRFVKAHKTEDDANKYLHEYLSVIPREYVIIEETMW